MSSVRSFFLVLLVLITHRVVFAQFTPSYTKYHAYDYNASVSNFYVENDSLGNVYFANIDGVIIYNGVDWESISIKDKTPVGFDIIDNKLYVGAVNEFGYVDLDEVEKKYTSLSDSFPDISFGGCYNFLSHKDTLYVASTNSLYAIHGNSIKSWNQSHLFGLANVLSVDNGHLMASGRYKGFSVLRNDSLISLLPNSAEGGRSLSSFINVHDDRVYFKGVSHNFYKYDSQADSLVEFDLLSDNLKKKMKGKYIRSIVELKENSYVLGTAHHGIIITENDSVLFTLNNKNGVNNSIRELLKDKYNNIWVSTFNGIFMLENIYQWAQLDSKLDDTVFSTDVSDNYILVASLTYARVFDLSGNFIFSFNTDLNMRNAELLGDNVVTLHGNKVEVHSVDGSKTILLSASEVDGYNSLSRVDKNSLFIFFDNSTYHVTLIDGVVSAQLLHKHLNITPHTTYRIREGVLCDSTFWFNANDAGLYSYDLRTHSRSMFNQKNGLTSVTTLAPFSYNGSLRVMGAGGAYKLNDFVKKDSSDLFVLDSMFEDIGEVYNFRHYKDGYLFVNSNVSGFRFGKLDKNENSIYTKQDIVDPAKNGFDIYQLQIKNDFLWTSAMETILRADLTSPLTNETNHSTYIRKVFYRDSLVFNSSRVGPPAKFLYAYNLFTFEYSSDFYEGSHKTSYRFQLEGFDEDWSDWSYSQQKQYTNLDFGSYTFKVESINMYGVIGQNDSYSFVVLPPWYFSWWAILLYVLFGLIIIFSSFYYYTRRIRFQRAKLRVMVSESTFKILEQSRDLENSKEELLISNQQLSDLNNSLESQVRNRTIEINSVLDDLKVTNSELNTFLYRASHDLKGPISRITGLASLLELEPRTPDNQEYFRRIDVAVNEMTRLLDKLTSLHELMNNDMSVDSIRLFPLVMDIIASFQHLDVNNEINFEINIQEGFIVHSDPEAVQLMIEALIENAIVFKDGVLPVNHTISITAAKHADSISIEFYDSGRGIPKSFTAKAFDMFSRASDESDGFGLGLYLAKKAIDKLSGTISIQSKVNEFTKVRVSLPNPSS